MTEKAPRPGQTTFAAWLIIAGSAVLVLTAWQRISSLHTLEVQEELQRVLSEPPVSGTGLSLESLKTTIRVLSMIAAGAATASAILGVQALRRSTSARLALTLLAPLVLIGGFATAGFFAPLVVAGVVMLWLRPTRDWFAGRPWLPSASGAQARRADPFAVQPREGIDTPARPQVPAAPAAPKAPVAPAATPEPESRPTATPGPYANPYGAPLGASAPVASPYHPVAKRPGALIAASVIVWVSCAFVSGFMLLFSLAMVVVRDDIFAELEKQPDYDLHGLSQTEFATSLFVVTAIVVLWSVVSAVLAVFAMLRKPWARVALAGSTGAALLLVLFLTAFVSAVDITVVLLVAAMLTTLLLLLRADVNAWFKR